MAISRSQRQTTIREIVRSRRVGSQRELVLSLAQRGIRVTQATVSRDIHALGLVKVPENGGSRYDLPERASSGPPARSAVALANLERTFRQSVSRMAEPAVMLTLHTPSGLANAVAVAVDQAALPEIVATIAGDDTVLVLLSDERSRKKVAGLLGGFLV